MGVEEAGGDEYGVVGRGVVRAAVVQVCLKGRGRDGCGYKWSGGCGTGAGTGRCGVWDHCAVCKA